MNAQRASDPNAVAIAAHMYSFHASASWKMTLRQSIRHICCDKVALYSLSVRWGTSCIDHFILLKMALRILCTLNIATPLSLSPVYVLTSLCVLTWLPFENLDMWISPYLCRSLAWVHESLKIILNWWMMLHLDARHIAHPSERCLWGGNVRVVHGLMTPF